MLTKINALVVSVPPVFDAVLDRQGRDGGQITTGELGDGGVGEMKFYRGSCSFPEIFEGTQEGGRSSKENEASPGG